MNLPEALKYIRKTYLPGPDYGNARLIANYLGDLCGDTLDNKRDMLTFNLINKELDLINQLMVSTDRQKTILLLTNHLQNYRLSEPLQSSLMPMVLAILYPSSYGLSNPSPASSTQSVGTTKRPRSGRKKKTSISSGVAASSMPTPISPKPITSPPPSHVRTTPSTPIARPKHQKKTSNLKETLFLVSPWILVMIVSMVYFGQMFSPFWTVVTWSVTILLCIISIAVASKSQRDSFVAMNLILLILFFPFGAIVSFPFPILWQWLTGISGVLIILVLFVLLYNWHDSGGWLFHVTAPLLLIAVLIASSPFLPAYPILKQITLWSLLALTIFPVWIAIDSEGFWGSMTSWPVIIWTVVAMIS